MSKKNREEDLLIDIVYRETFDKRRPNHDLRMTLLAARRFVLADEMAAFIVDLAFENLFGRTFRQVQRGRPLNTASLRKRVFRLLDQMRHFSRLPHRVTWIEFSYDAFVRRERAIADELGIENASAITPDGEIISTRKWNEQLELARGVRVGWLMRQIGTSETAFDCTRFTNEEGKMSFSPCAMIWDTDEAILPFRLQEPAKGTGSEMALGITGYVRENVGYHPMANHIYNGTDEEFREAIVNSLHEQDGNLRYVWAFLSTLNKIPLAQPRIVKPTRGFMGRGSYHRFLEHSIITLNIPQKSS